MPRVKRWVALVGVPMALVLGAAVLLDRAPTVAATIRPDAALSQPTPLRVVGVAGCASAGCHGGPMSQNDSLTKSPDERAWASAASHVMASDPHTRAYAALTSELANAIVTKLKWKVATNESRCLACHTNPTLAEKADDSEIAREGVSCEGCHGNSRDWLREHTKKSDTRYTPSSMAKLNDLGERALVCAGCHVGAPADPQRDYPLRDVNHDMIAAGHPRLNFEFAEYQRRLPPHWYERDREPEFEVRAWLVGRVAHAEAACRLLADRTNRTWPEFAEWSCVSCHHTIDERFPRKSGTPQWQTIWPFSPPVPANGVKAGGMEKLLKAMQVSRPGEQVKDDATRTADEFALIRTRLVKSSGSDVSKDASTILRNSSLEELDWDRANQMYHGLAAAERTRIRWDPKQAPDPAFGSLAKKLLSPRGNLTFDVQDAQEELKRMLNAK